jgi:hypothetical protein
MGEWRYTSTILDLGTRWRLVVSFKPRPLLYPRGKSPLYPLDRRLGGPQSRSGRCEDEKNLAVLGIEPWPSSYTDWATPTPYTRIIFIIITSKTALFEPQPSLEDSTKFDLVLTSLDFTTVIFLQSKVVNLAFNPQPGGPDLCIYVPSDRVVQLYPQAPSSLFFAFYDSQSEVF